MKSSMPGEHVSYERVPVDPKQYERRAAPEFEWRIVDEVDHGPRKTTSLDAEWTKDLGPDVRAAMRRHAYDRTGGINPGSTEGLIRKPREEQEEEYLNALYEAFRPALARLSEQHQLYVDGIKTGQTTRAQAASLGIDQANVVRGRQRALEALAKVLGAEGIHDKPGIRRGLLAGTNFPLTEWLPGFTEGSKG